VLELPLDGGHELDAASVYRSVFHFHPTLNGFSGHVPLHYELMRLGLESGDQRLLTTFASWGRILIAIDHRNDPAQDWMKYVSSHEGIVPLGTFETWSFFLLPAAPGESPPAITGRELLPQRISSNFSSDLTLFLLDNDPFTRWTTRGPQRGDEQVMVDMGAPKELTGVALSLGGYAHDFARHLVIDTSPDGEHWTTAWSGTTAALSMAAALNDPIHVNLEFQFNSPTARFVRLRQTGTAVSHGWSIAKLAVFGTAM
jgi:F5/8 type C domain